MQRCFALNLEVLVMVVSLELGINCSGYGSDLLNFSDTVNLVFLSATGVGHLGSSFCGRVAMWGWIVSHIQICVVGTRDHLQFLVRV